MSQNGLIYDIGDRPRFGQLLIFALQQVLAIIAATIAVPTIIGLPAQIPAAILGAGIGTIVYLLFTRFKSPVFLGSSFAFLSSLMVAMSYGYLGIIVGSLFAGLVYVIFALIIHFAGTAWVNKLLPPVIIGPTVAIIGLSLAANAMGDIVKASGNIGGVNIYSDYNLVALLCGLIAFLTIVLCSSQKRFKMMRLIPFVIGICAGYAAAAIFTAIGYATDCQYLMIIDFSPIVNNFVNDAGEFAGITAFLNYPDFALIEAIKELVNGESSIAGAAALDGGAIAEVAIAFVPVAFVVFAEHIADHKNLSTIIGRDLITDPGLKRTLLGDGVGSMAGTVFGICPNTTYGESVGCIAITKNASISTIFTAAVMCIVISFISPLMAVLRTIPSCVMGGVCLTLYGFIAVSGLKMFKDLDLGENKNLFVVSAILIAGIGGFTIQIPYAVGAGGAVEKTIQITSIATALILGIVTNLVLGKLEKKQAGDGGDSLITAAVPENADGITPVEEEALVKTDAGQSEEK